MSNPITPTQDAASTGTEDSRERQLAGLKAAGNAKTQKARQKVANGIRDLIKTGARISISSVARTSGVSRAFINKHPDLVERVRVLAAQQQGSSEAVERSISGESTVISALRRKIRDQEDAHKMQIQDLRKQLREKDEQIAKIYGTMPPN